jgi:hypothetical protein
VKSIRERAVCDEWSWNKETNFKISD